MEGDAQEAFSGRGCGCGRWIWWFGPSVLFALVVLVLALRPWAGPVGGTRPVGADGAPSRSPARSLPSAGGNEQPGSRARLPHPPSTGSASESLEQWTSEIRENLETIVQTEFRAPIQVRSVTAGEAMQLMEAEFDRDTPPARLQAVQRALIRLGLFPEGFRLRETFLQLMGQQAAGFYIPRKKAFYLIERMPLPSVIAAHELTHALQDQLFDLQALLDARKTNDDALAALQAVFEGEAVLSMTFYMQRYSGKWEVVSGVLQSSLMSGAQMESLRSVPLYLQHRLLFPYVKGKDFVLRALREGGWGGVRRLFRDLPESSEQILHPDKYFGPRDRPTRIVFPQLAAHLGRGWTVRAEDTLGELGVGLLLQTLTGRAIDSLRAAQGWDGDRFALLEKGPEAERRRGLLWLSTWDTRGCAHRFLGAYQDAITNRFGVGPDRKSTRVYGWTGLEKRAILLSRWGREVLLLDDFTQLEQASIRRWLSACKHAGTLFAEDHRDDVEPEHHF